MLKETKTITPKEIVTRKAKYRVRNSEGVYEIVHLETSADQVQETAERVFVTPDEKGKITSSHSAIEGINSKIAIINGNDSQSGSIAKALKDAKTYTDGKFGEVDGIVDSKVETAKGEINGTISTLTGRVQTNEESIQELKSVVAQKGSRTVVVDTEEEIATANSTPQKGDMAYVITSKRAYIYKGVEMVLQDGGVPEGWVVFDEITNELDLVDYLKKSDADTTYLKKTDAESTYLKTATANTDFLKKAEASSTYLPTATAESTYLKTETADATYFKKSDKIQETNLHADLQGKINGKIDATAVDSKIDAKLDPVKSELNSKIDNLVPTLGGLQPEDKLEGHVWLEIVE